jgi:hypothetical protein
MVRYIYSIHPFRMPRCRLEGYHRLTDLDIKVNLSSENSAVGNIERSVYCQTSPFLRNVAQRRSAVG